MLTICRKSNLNVFFSSDELMEIMHLASVAMGDFQINFNDVVPPQFIPPHLYFLCHLLQINCQNSALLTAASSGLIYPVNLIQSLSFKFARPRNYTCLFVPQPQPRARQQFSADGRARLNQIFINEYCISCPLNSQVLSH